jgi:long-chain acyl-CoA synthetase
MAIIKDRPGTDRPATSFIGCEAARTLPGLFRQRVESTPDASAYRQFQDGAWRDTTWAEMARLVACWQRGLEAEGLKPGERVAVSLRNGVDWVAFDQAALGLGLVVVPLYTTDNPDNLAHILADSGSRLLLIASDARWAPLAGQSGALPELRRVLCVTRSGGSESSDTDDRLRFLGDWLPEEGGELVDRVQDPTSLATLVYTSGTTGPPKGVMLSHRAILWNVEAVQPRVPVRPRDLFLSFLPLAHAFERTVGYYLPMMGGACVAYARSIEQLRHDLMAVRPTVLLSVPRVYELVYLAIQSKLGGAGPRRWLFEAGISIGWRRFQGARGRARPPGPLARLLWSLLEPRIARPVLEQLGGRIRVSVSGGAPLSPAVAQFFVSLGLPLTEGYGLTEAGPVVSGTTPEDWTPGSVGRALPGIEVALSPKGELLVRAPSVMSGYWGRPEATRETIDADGWLHTGDLAEISDGIIRIRGRLKEILVTSSGEKVPPADMQLALTLDPLFDQALVLGEGRPYLAALLVLNPQAWDQVAAGLGLDPADGASLENGRALRYVRERVRDLLKGFPGYAQVRAIHLTLEPWTVENGLLTPTLKVKRQPLESRFAPVIQALYRHRDIPR